MSEDLQEEQGADETTGVVELGAPEEPAGPDTPAEKAAVPGQREEEVSIISILNGIASSIQGKMEKAGTPLVTIIVAGRHPENSGVFEIEVPDLGESEKLCAKLATALQMSEHLGHAKADLADKLR